MKKAALASALVSLACLFCAASLATPAQNSGTTKITPDMIQTASDIPTDWKQPQSNFDYIKRDAVPCASAILPITCSHMCNVA